MSDSPINEIETKNVVLDPRDLPPELIDLETVILGEFKLKEKRGKNTATIHFDKLPEELPKFIHIVKKFNENNRFTVVAQYNKSNAIEEKP